MLLPGPVVQPVELNRSADRSAHDVNGAVGVQGDF
jgi:hypothetical protein